MIFQAVLLLEPVEQAAGLQLILLQAKKLRNSVIVAACFLRLSRISEKYEDTANSQKWEEASEEYTRKILANGVLDIKNGLVLLRSLLVSSIGRGGDPTRTFLGALF